MDGGSGENRLEIGTSIGHHKRRDNITANKKEHGGNQTPSRRLMKNDENRDVEGEQ